jgi:hypothetical protein
MRTVKGQKNRATQVRFFFGLGSAKSDSLDVIALVSGKKSTVPNDSAKRSPEIESLRSGSGGRRSFSSPGFHVLLWRNKVHV